METQIKHYRLELINRLNEVINNIDIEAETLIFGNHDLKISNQEIDLKRKEFIEEIEKIKKKNLSHLEAVSARIASLKKEDLLLSDCIYLKNSDLKRYSSERFPLGVLIILGQYFPTERINQLKSLFEHEKEQNLILEASADDSRQLDEGLFESAYVINGIINDQIITNNIIHLNSRPNSDEFKLIVLKNFKLKSIDNKFFLGFKNLKNINLSHNKIENLDNDTFNSLQSLESLILCYNSIKTVHKDAFSSVKNLQRLNLANNHIQYLEDETFCPLVNVDELTLSSNSITRISDKIFSTLTNLKRLNLSDNNINQVEHRAFYSLKNLEWLDMSNHFLKSFPSDLFVNLSQLKLLNIYSRDSISINDQIFRGLNNLEYVILNNYAVKYKLPNLFINSKKLKRSNIRLNNSNHFNIPFNFYSEIFESKENLISNLGDRGFLEELSQIKDMIITCDQPIDKNHMEFFRQLNKLENFIVKNFKFKSEKLARHADDLNTEKLLRDFLTLKKLSIKFESIDTKLQPNAFNKLTELTSLVLEDCRIKSIDRNYFRSMNNLRHLELSSNVMYSIDDNVFSDLPCLKVLDLSHNCISHLNEHTFKGLDRLEKLDLSYNSIEHIDPSTFSNLKNLTELHLLFNSIGSISTETFENQTNLEVLILTKNFIANIDHSALRNLKKLVRLSLQRNKIEIIPDLSCLVNLEHLGLMHNKIKELNTKIFANLSQIKEIFLNFNDIEEIVFDDSVELRNVCLLNLASNEISKIHGSYMKNFPNLMEFYSRHNPAFTDDDEFFYTSRTFLAELCC